jgi:hypothetical protein
MFSPAENTNSWSRKLHYSTPRRQLAIFTGAQGFYKSKIVREPSSWMTTYALRKAEEIVMVRLNRSWGLLLLTGG